MSKPSYCPHTAWFDKAELGRLGAFHASCFRKIRRASHQNPAVQTGIMLRKRVAHLQSEDVMRTCVFHSDCFKSLTDRETTNADAQENVGLCWGC